jgi:glycosyltransferase involved in cell wall biosynthesis
MMVSFIIPAYNEESLLPSTIQSIHTSASKVGIEYEIVVADDDSDDNTANIALELGATVAPTKNRQIAATRNAGALASNGEMIIWVDADTRVTAGAVRGAVKAMTLGASGGGVRVIFDRPCPLYARLLFPMLMMTYRFARLASGAFIFCTRETFETTGGFDESMYAGEEAIMSRAIGRCGRFAWVDDPVYTSSRKLRTYTGGEIIIECIRLAAGGMKGTRTRDKKDIWYGPRRPDPAPPPPKADKGTGV